MAGGWGEGQRRSPGEFASFPCVCGEGGACLQAVPKMGMETPPAGRGTLQPLCPPPACLLPFRIFTPAARVMEPAQVSLAEQSSMAPYCSWVKSRLYSFANRLFLLRPCPPPASFLGAQTHAEPWPPTPLSPWRPRSPPSGPALAHRDMLCCTCCVWLSGWTVSPRRAETRGGGAHSECGDALRELPWV